MLPSGEAGFQQNHYRRVPTELKALRRWCRWSTVNGSKLPSQVNGAAAKSNDESTWTDFETVEPFDRVATFLKEPYCGVDLDGCLDDSGKLKPWAVDLVARLSEVSYSEISPSGLGIKFITRARKPPGSRCVHKIGHGKQQIECYDHSRFWTVTGEVYASCDEIKDGQAVIDWLCREYLNQHTNKVKTPKPQQADALMQRAARWMKSVESADSGERNNKAFSTAGHLWAFVDDAGNRLSESQIAELMADWNSGNQPPLPEAELQRAIASARTNGTPRADKLPAGRGESFSHSNAAGSDDWPELMPISGPEPESIVPEDFPECVAGIVRAAMDCLEVPCELPALLALGVLATACQKRFQILSAGIHVEPLSLFLLPALNPGERKTAAKSLIVKPIEVFERQLQAAVADEIREAESKRQTAFKRIEHLRGVAAKDRDAKEREIAQREIDELEAGLPPARYKPQLLCDDCTPEHVATLLSRNGERMAVLSDEAGVFDLINGRYSAKGPNLDVFLQSHAGSQVRVDRGSRESVLLHNPAMTICCSVQPFVLQELGANRAFRGRGLVARFLFAMPKSRLGFRTLQPKQVPERVESQWNDLVHELLAIPQHHDEFNGPTALTISLSPEAYRIWRQEQRQTEKEMRPGGAWNSETGWGSKFPGALLRVAGVLHCAVCVSQGNSPADVRVTESTMEAAVRIGRKIKQHSLKVFSVMQLTDDFRFAAKIAEWIQRTGQTEFTGRDCQRSCHSKGQMKDLNGALNLLTEYGWIRSAGEQKPEGGGRPSHPFEVNPAVREITDKTDKTPEWGDDDDVLSVLSQDSGGSVVADDDVLSVLSADSGGTKNRNPSVGRDDFAWTDTAFS